ncbi:MAG: Type II secretion system protein E [bacterium ADurb.Bin429]|nr:MAG: Type II secretion system protein E [bacterium ADurb.Bin429]
MAIDRADSISLEEQLTLRNRFLETINRIHSAQSVRQILLDVKENILTLFHAHAITIYAVDRGASVIYSFFLAGSEIKEIRLPIAETSIAGYVAQRQRIVNIMDAYDRTELDAIDPALAFDAEWDQKTGLRTRQVLAVPILYNKEVLGVIQLVNRKGGGRFTGDEQQFLVEVAITLGVAFHNREHATRRYTSRFDYLVSRGLLTDAEVRDAIVSAQREKISVELYLMRAYAIPKDEIGKALEIFYGCPFIHYDDALLAPRELLKKLNPEYLRRECWVPLDGDDGTIRVAIDDPDNVLKHDAITVLYRGAKIRYCVALPDDIHKYIARFFNKAEAASIDQIIESLDASVESDIMLEEEDAYAETDNEIVQLVNRVLNDAVARRASDIHIEPNVGKRNVDIRFRIDGDCLIYQTIPYGFRNAVISRIKIMANLDITERRKPQDGKIVFTRSTGESIELRVATVPTVGGVEDVVMRVLVKGGTLPLKAMGLREPNLDALRAAAEKPYGMILVVGPTGSGKTTTLHGVLQHINTPLRKIWTAEDPVEITQYGLRQVQVQPKIGFDFATAMRSFLRADPDVIMVGEMRDLETARTAVEASLTGHLVFSTLHTNSAPETIVRLLDMGIDPLNFADSLLGILAQRLVRTLCPRCKEAYHPDRAEYDALVELFGPEWWAAHAIPYTDDLRLHRAKGCAECEKTGYRGRMGLHELLINTLEVKTCIQKRETVETMRELAMGQGMTTLLQDGILKCFAGYTDIGQVRRVCIK